MIIPAELNTFYHKPEYDFEGKYPKIAKDDYISIIYKDLDTGKKYMDTIEKPTYIYYKLNDDQPEPTYNKLFIEKEKVHPIEVPYRDLLKNIAIETHNEEFYRFNAANNKKADNKKLHTDPSIFFSDQSIDDHYRLNIINGWEVGKDWRTTGESEGQFEDNASAKIYIMGKITDEEGRPIVIGGRKAPLSDDSTVDEMFRSVGEYTLINIYSITNGIDFYNNFTPIMNTRVNIYDAQSPLTQDLEVQNVPGVGAHYFETEENVAYFIHELSRKKVYIDYCLSLVENNMDIDFKYFNTYGESKTYLASTETKSPLGNIDITMEFRIKLMTNANEVYVKQAVITYVKNYIENLNETFEDFHVSSLIHDIMEEMHNDIVYIEFRRFNKNELGVDHIELMNTDSIYTVPEFICIRNRKNTDGDLEPWIEVTIMAK